MPADRGELTPEQQQAELDAFDVEVGQELQEESPFLAEIKADEVVVGKYGAQWHLGVKPLQFELRGKTGMFHQYAGRSGQLRSVMGAMLTSLQAEKIAPTGTKVGKGQLVGLVAWFVKRDIKFGRNSSGEEMKSEGVLIFYKKATEEEQALAGTSPATAGAAVAPPEAPDWDADQCEAIITAIMGMDPKAAQKAGLDRNHPASHLPRELKGALLNGSAIPTLVEMGKIMVDEENGGVIARVPVATA